MTQATQNFPKKILITGGTGFIGQQLVKRFVNLGSEITILSRQNQSPKQAIRFISNLDEIDFEFDAVINLAGEPIAQRWSATKKQQINASRMEITKKLAIKIQQAKLAPSVFLSGSAIGFYGNDSKIIFDENSAVNLPHLFSAELCNDWEQAAKAVQSNTRLVLLRMGVVLGKNGGFLSKLLPPFRLGLGGKMGDGNQFLSWIHLSDAVRAIEFIIQNHDIVGAINLTSPKNITNRDFSKKLAKLLNRPCFCSVPAIAMKLIYGQMAEELILGGQQVQPTKLLGANFRFEFEDIEAALSDILGS